MHKSLDVKQFPVKAKAGGLSLYIKYLNTYTSVSICIHPFWIGPPSEHSTFFGDCSRWPFAIYSISVYVCIQSYMNAYQNTRIYRDADVYLYIHTYHIVYIIYIYMNTYTCMCIRIRRFGIGPPSVYSAGYGNSGRCPSLYINYLNCRTNKPNKKKCVLL